MRSKPSIEQITNKFEERGFQLLSQAYEGSGHKLQFRCSEGHEGSIKWSNFRAGNGCLRCAWNNKALSLKLSIEEVKSRFKEEGFDLLSQEYKNNGQKLEVQCKQEHKFIISLSNFQAGNRCPRCSNAKKAKNIEEVRIKFKEKGFELLSKTYMCSDSKLNVRCENGHEVDIAWTTFQRGQGCPRCSNYGFSRAKPAILYYIRFQFKDKYYYKIGITNNTIEKRFGKKIEGSKILLEKVFLFGYLAYEEEQKILEKHKKYKYVGDSFLPGGNTELFTTDVLKLDQSIKLLN